MAHQGEGGNMKYYFAGAAILTKMRGRLCLDKLGFLSLREH